jgi:hypothetical protein
LDCYVQAAPEVPASVAGIIADLTKLATYARQDGKVAQKTKAVFVGAASWTAKLSEARAIVQTAAAQAPNSRPL